MITKFTLFENINIDEPQVKDYVICELRPDIFFNTCSWYVKYLELINILKNKVGRIIKKEDPYYLVEYDDISKELRKLFFTKNEKKELKCRRVTLDEIEFWSKRKKTLIPTEIEMFRKSKKYNIL